MESIEPYANKYERKIMFKRRISKPVIVSVIGVYESLQAASKQVDLYLKRQDSAISANIVSGEHGYTATAVKWQ